MSNDELKFTKLPEGYMNWRSFIGPIFNANMDAIATAIESGGSGSVDEKIAAEAALRVEADNALQAEIDAIVPPEYTLKVFTKRINPADWDLSTKRVDVTVTGILESDIVFAVPKPESNKTYTDFDVMLVNCYNDMVTFTCSDIPEIYIDVNLICIR